ncbi:hypothetical protein [Brassicibacter mesophilus]|uniref:hypothetical protein n=1 Tax=Brassicibacter mesophilus TaxID=745119 RepID=UPI003D1D463D
MLRSIKKIAILLGLALIVSSSILGWTIIKNKTLNVVIIDKTVPDISYREHKGLMWVLNSLKYTHGEKKLPYRYNTDYYGFFPKENKDFEVNKLPKTLENTDFIYLADTYGVYEDEYYDDIDRGEKSKLIYGGLTEEEVETIKETMYRNGSTLVAEFNTFGSPTDINARKEMYNLLGLEWTGWIGRYFNDLSRDVEIPEWTARNFEKQYNKKWSFNGAGFVFVNEENRLIVLEEGKDTGKDGCQIEFNDKGKELFGINKSVHYNYWFDVVEPRNNGIELASYRIDLTQQGEEKLSREKLPTIFPAVIKNNNRAFTTYYFAGDFSDINKVPRFYKVLGLSKIKKYTTIDTKQSEDAFYWKVYVPMIEKILKEASTKDHKVKTTIEVDEKDGVKINAKAGNDKLQIMVNGEWEDTLIKGVNMGIAKPGYFPGETAISKDEYLRWFNYIGEMNANAIRVYTLHPPAFYEAFYEYNMTSDKPLYLFHGVWINEEELVKSQNAFEQVNETEFKQEIKNIVDVIHGNAIIKERRGHASGVYRYDISKYVIGWILGIEWDPHMVNSTNEKNSELKDYQGQYVYTKEASPFEIWLAEMIDYTVGYETEKYNWQRPMSFTNWVTTDLLSHPAEPLENEDLVSVNPNNIYAKDNLYTGLFASYHIYPYYPDFMNYEDKYLQYEDKNGVKNTYAGYLKDLIEQHKIPVLVAEFGIPASRGLTHKNVYDMNQGFNSEKKQGEIDAKLFNNIVDEGYAGGLIFTWQDEWFKRTWNTMDYDNPDRRPMWSNAQTNEQQFGLLSFDPGASLKVKIDGNIDEWEGNGSIKAYESQNQPNYHSFYDGYDEGRNLEKMFATSDERYLYLRIDYKDLGDKVDWEKMNTLIFIDSKKNQGNTTLPFNTNVKSDAGVDFIIQLNGKDNSRVLIDSYYDTFYYQYAEKLNMIPKNDYASKKDNGIYHKIELALNKGLFIPNKSQYIPFEKYETGRLMMGIGDPDSNEYNSLADFYVSEKNNTIEIRIPWLLLNVKDPSSREVMGDIWSQGISSSEITEGFHIGALTFKPDKNGEATVTGKEMNITDSLPMIKGEKIYSESLFLYSWESWDVPTYHERLKKSYYIIKDLFEKFN